MVYTQLKKEEVKKLYMALAIIDKINQIVFKNDDESIDRFVTTLFLELNQLSKPAEYMHDIFKLELSNLISEIAIENKQLYGLPWFSKSDVFLDMLNALEEAAYEILEEKRT